MGSENDELTRIRDWMKDNQASYEVHRFFRDVDPVVSMEEAMSARATGDGARVIGGTDQDKDVSPPNLRRALTFSTWLRDPEVATRESFSSHDFTITLKHDTQFSNYKLDPSGTNAEARFVLPAGSVWSYTDGQPVSCGYPDGSCIWSAETGIDRYDEDGQLCGRPDEPWCPSYLQLHSYKDKGGEWVNPHITTTTGCRHGTRITRASAKSASAKTSGIADAATSDAMRR